MLFVAGLALISLGAVAAPEQFVIKIDQWAGLSSDEQYAPQLGPATDMVNFEIGVAGGATYLKQRRGIRRVTGFLPMNVYILAAGMYTPRGYTQSIVIAGSNDKFYSCSRADTNHIVWAEVSTWNGDSTHPTRRYTNFIQFKDTLVGAGADSINLFVPRTGATNRLSRVLSYAWTYGRLLVHQDRVYAYNVAYSGSANDQKLAWMPEFDLRFNLLDTAIGSGYVYIGRDDADFMTNVLAMGGNLVAYKSHSIYNVLIGSETNKPEQIIKITDNVGALCYDAACSYNNIHYFVSADGVFQYDGSAVAKISQAIDGWFRDSLQVIKTVESSAIVIQAVENRLYVALPLRSPADERGTAGLRIFVYDLMNRIWWKMIPNPVPDNNVHQFLRYDYPDGVAVPFGGSTTDGFRYRSRLIMLYDSAVGANHYNAAYMFPGDMNAGTKTYNDNGGRTNPSYTTGFVPVHGLWSRSQLQRAGIFGSGDSGTSSIACTVKVDWYGEAGTIIDSTKFPLTSAPGAVLKRLPPSISGQMLKFRIRTSDTALVKINLLEIIGSQKGLANDN